MKKRNLKVVKLNKNSISNLELNASKGGLKQESLNLPCEVRNTYNTYCPDLSVFRNNC